MDVDGARVAGERVAPDALQQLVSREHETVVVEQLPEEVELLGRELHVVPVDLHLAAAGVDEQLPVTDLRRLRLLPLRRRAAEDRLHAGDELARVERLRQVVVGADLEPDDLVDVLVASRQHQDRNIGRMAQPPADLDPVDVRQHQVENDERRRLGLGQGERVTARRGDFDAVPGVAQIHRHERGDRRFVLDHQHGLRVGRCHRASRIVPAAQPPEGSEESWMGSRSSGIDLYGDPLSENEPSK